MQEEASQYRRHRDVLQVIRVCPRFLCFCGKRGAGNPVVAFDGAPWLSIDGELAHNGSTNSSSKGVRLCVVLVCEESGGQGFSVNDGPDAVSSCLVNVQILRDARSRDPLWLLVHGRKRWTDDVRPSWHIHIRGDDGRQWLDVRELSGAGAPQVKASLAVTPRILMIALAALLEPSDGCFCGSPRTLGARFPVRLEICALPACCRTS
jgi:hypothetical protein